MCCVIGYIGTKPSRALIVDGLARLEYRGYDSAGFACLGQDRGQIQIAKVVGGVERLVQQCAERPIDGFLGVGHTRWSTHGAANVENAHPLTDCHGQVAVAHNGIIENFAELRTQLRASGHLFKTETDTEVIAHVLEQELSLSPDLPYALGQVVNRLEGAYAFVALLQNRSDVLVAVRRRSPLCIGISEEGTFVASDQIAFAGKAREVLFLPDGSYALVYKDRYEVYDFSGKRLMLTPSPLTLTWQEGGKQGYAHYMLKEIYEQKRVIFDIVKAMRTSGHLLDTQLGVSYEYLRELEQIVLIGCGTSLHAARVAAFFFEKLCKIPVTVGLASEFKHQELFLSKKSLCIAISQSGETADTLEVVRLLLARNIPTIALTNVATSTMVRESQGFLLMHAGQEVAVASTKSFTAQLASLFLLAHTIAQHKGLLSVNDTIAAQEELLIAAEVMEKAMETYKESLEKMVAPRYAHAPHTIFLGRHLGHVLAQEAALKLKEIAYIFSEAFPAGELKHGPIALVEKGLPVFMFSVLDPVIYKKLVSNAQEVKSRGGQIIAFAFEGQDELIGLADTAFVFSPVHELLAPIAMVGVMQLLVYQISCSLNRPIDKPRNLAKSVTVE